MSFRLVRRPAITFLAALVAALPLAALVAPPARGATPDLTMVVAATYDVQPDAHQVAVTLVITATNHLKDTASNRYVFDRAPLAVQPEASELRVSGGLGRPKVTVSARDASHALLQVSFGGSLAAGASTTFTLTYLLADQGGAPDRSVRVGAALVAFPVWAFATDSTPGSSSVVVFPAGYNVEVVEGTMSGPVAGEGGRQAWATGTLDDPVHFYAYIRGSRTTSTIDVSRIIEVGTSAARLTFRAWADDQEWLDRVRGMALDVLPGLGTEIGLPWPIDTPVTVDETLVRSADGHAGIFDPASGSIHIAYYADDAVIAHEIAHAWFNGGFVAERWAAEGFASYYAEVAARDAGRTIASPALTAEEQAAAIPLNAWGAAPAGDAAPTDPATEAYGYAASLSLARAIAVRAGSEGLRAVWAAVASGTYAYQPATGTPEVGSGPPDWRGMLDLLEDITGKRYADLWQTWVVRPADAALLAQRDAARTAYSDLLADAGDWGSPRVIRDALRSWHFDLAIAQIAQAKTVVADRDALAPRAAAAGLTMPDTLRSAYGAGDLALAIASAAAEGTAIDRIVQATAARPAQPDWLQSLGLVGADPARDLAAARTSFAAGEMLPAASAAAAAETSWRSATDVGRGRVLGILALVAALLLLAGLLAGQRRRRRRPHARPMGGGRTPVP